MRYHLIAAALVAISVGSESIAQTTTLPLNTGYDYTIFGLYPAAPTTGNSPILDNYWIKIASYEPPTGTVTVAPAWVISPGGWPTLSGARWLGPRPLAAATPGTSASVPAYSIFRKCFCLMQGFQNPQISIQFRADNQSQVWLNTVTAQLIPASLTSWNATNPLTGSLTDASKFRVGLNCIYVLVEDTGGAIGFVLSGTVTATGLLPVAGAGVGPNPTFGNCSCGDSGTPAPAGLPTSASASLPDENTVVRAIIELAEANLRERLER